MQTLGFNTCFKHKCLTLLPITPTKFSSVRAWESRSMMVNQRPTDVALCPLFKAKLLWCWCQDWRGAGRQQILLCKWPVSQLWDASSCPCQFDLILFAPNPPTILSDTISACLSLCCFIFSLTPEIIQSMWNLHGENSVSLSKWWFH